jgi:protein-disulfide isomerase
MNILTPPIGPRDHVAGQPDPSVTLVEFGDYQCPFCGQAQPVVRALLQSLGDRLLFAFRHFPLTDLHPQALGAAVAAEAAGMQGKFWEMHETLFAHQNALGIDDLLGYAELLGLDLDRFSRDLEDDRSLTKVQEDVTSGVRSGVMGTPTFFIDGVRHDGSWDFDSLSMALLNAAARRDAPAAQPGE